MAISRITEARGTELAAIVRAVVARRADLDPWLEFPQNSSCFLFGQRKSPVPIGALYLLWDLGSPWRKPCHRCGGDLRGYACGGLLTFKCLFAVCVDCERSFTEIHGGSLGSAAAWLLPLKGTEFFMSSGCFGGTYGSKGQLLLKALKLPYRQAESGVSYSIQAGGSEPPPRKVSRRVRTPRRASKKTIGTSARGQDGQRRR
jgi:hypothetical protein